MTGISTAARPTVAICAALLIGACAGGENAGEASPRPTTSSNLTSDQPMASPSSTVNPLRDQGGEAILAPGSYVLDRFPVDIVFDIPDGSQPGWHVGTSTEDAAIVLWYTPPDITYVFAFWNADNVYVDPCNADTGQLEPQVGPSVDALVTALSNLPGFQTTAPADVAVGAFQGKQIELTAVDSEGDCPELIAFTSGDDEVGISAGETLRLQILDVDGLRIVMSPSRWVNTQEPMERDPAAEAELQQILDSVRTERLP